MYNDETCRIAGLCGLNELDSYLGQIMSIRWNAFLREQAQVHLFCVLTVLQYSIYRTTRLLGADDFNSEESRTGAQHVIPGRESRRGYTFVQVHECFVAFHV